DGKRLGFIQGGELRLYDVAGGKMLEKPVIDKGVVHSWRSVHAWSGGWIVSNESNALVFHEPAKKWGPSIPFRTVIHLQEIDAEPTAKKSEPEAQARDRAGTADKSEPEAQARAKPKRLLLQSYLGLCCLADPVSGKVLDRWFCTEYGQYRAPAW